VPGYFMLAFPQSAHLAAKPVVPIDVHHRPLRIFSPMLICPQNLSVADATADPSRVAVAACLEPPQ
jgi:hypothetical protein